MAECTECGGPSKEALEYKYLCQALNGTLPAPVVGGGDPVPATTRVIDHVEALVDGSTDPTVKSVSIIFRGPGGMLNGVSVPDNYSVSYSDPLGVKSIAYNVPTGGETRVLISYVR